MKNTLNTIITESQASLPLESVSIIRNLRNYLAGRAVGISNDSALLEEILKIFFCVRLYSDQYKDKKNDLLYQAKKIREDFINIKKAYPDLYEKKEEVLLDPKSIHHVVEALQSLNNYSSNRKIDVVASLYQAFIGNHIRGQEGQFFTPVVAIDFLVNSIKPQPTWKVIDTACGACSFLSTIYLTILNNFGEKKAKEFAKNNLYGIEKDTELSRLAKIHLTLLTGEMPQIITGDSLLVNKDGSVHVEDNFFDLVITNPPFGSKIKAADSETAEKYKLGYAWSRVGNHYEKTDRLLSNASPQTLFTERNIRALKRGGILATVLPESLLSNKNYKSAAQFILQECNILAVVGMPESLFKTSGKGGTHTKTCLLIAEKRGNHNKEARNIFMAEAKWCGHDSRGNSIPKNDLPNILDNYLRYKLKRSIVPSHLGYLLSSDKIDDLILAPRYYDVEFASLQKKASKDNGFITVGKLVDMGVINIATGDEVGKLAYGTGDVAYIRTSDISNWEVKFDNKHSVNRDVYDKFKGKQDIKEGDILMVKDGTYLIGTVAIVTAVDKEMVYQSHLYKIRVNRNELGITSYNLFALLISDFVQRQIKSKQLTQDIIDSLGKRIYELQIPIPKNKKVLQNLDGSMKEVFDLKREIKYKMLDVKKDINRLF